MRRTTFALMLACVPGFVAAQGQSTGQTQGQSASQSQVTAGFSAETRVRLEAMLQAARDSKLPTGAMTSIMAEGQAKGASEAQIVAATQRTEAALSASHDALISAGYSQPTDAQVERGAQLIVNGASGAQLEAVARKAPSEHRLDVALQVLTNLTAQGVPVDHALSVVGSLSADGSASGQSNPSTPAGQPGQSSSASLSGAVLGKLGIGLGRKP